MDEPLQHAYSELKEKARQIELALSKDRSELELLLNTVPTSPPTEGSEDYGIYMRLLAEIDSLKKRIGIAQEELIQVLTYLSKMLDEL